MPPSLSTSRFLTTYLWPQRGRVVALAGLLLGSIALQLVSPQILRAFLDSAQAGSPLALLTRIAGLFLLVAFAQQFLAIGTAYLGEDLGWRATNRLRADLTRHCLHLDLSFHNLRTPGELIERVDGDVSTLANFFSEFVIRVLGNFLLALGILVLLFREEWRVGLVGVGYALLLFGFMRLVQRRVVQRWAQAREADAHLFGFLEERLTGTEDIRANGGERFTLRRLAGLMTRRLEHSRQAELLARLTYVLGFLLYVLGQVATLAVGATLFLRGEMTIGTVYLLVYYLGVLEGPLNSLREQMDDLQQALASIGRVRDLLAIQPKVQQEGQATLPAGPLALTFDRVSFSYQEEGRTLSDLSFTLEPGRVLGLLGHTGSGKSTLTRLLFRLYDPTTGTIRLGGQESRSVRLADLRQRVGMVTQEVQLFEATVRDNLTFFDRRISDERLLEGLHTLGLGAWLAALPDGLDTMLGAGGRGLSAGEGQLLAFTRVLLKDPGLVILDEASSRLDPLTERLLEQAIERLLHGRTGILIAHRLETLQRADDILILEGGRVVEWGARVALLATPDSRFTRLLHTGMEEVLA